MLLAKVSWNGTILEGFKSAHEQICRAQCYCHDLIGTTGATKATFRQNRPFWAATMHLWQQSGPKGMNINRIHPEEVLGQVSKNFGSTWAYMGFSPSGLVSKGRKAPKHSKAKTPSQNCLILFVIDIMSRDLSKRDNIGRVFLNFLFSQWLGEKARNLLGGCLGHFFTNFQWGTYKHTPYWTQKPFLQHLTTPGFFSQLANFTGRKVAKKDNRPQS